MKRFEFPEMNIEMFISEDVITTSGGATTPATNSDSVQQQMSAMNDDLSNKKFMEVLLMR